MKTLFISTYSGVVTIGLLISGKLLAKKEVVSERSHSKYLVPLIEEILEEHQMNSAALNEVIVVNGPGSFTGVRLGVTVAKTLAYTLSIPIKTITSIEAIALSVSDFSKGVISIPDAKGFYFAFFKDNTIVSEIQYKKRDDYLNYIKEQGAEEILSPVLDLNLEVIHAYLKDQKNINPHMVKPFYVKKLEVMK